MPNTVYLVGAGLTKSLQTDRPVPLMMDFVRVMADYLEADDSNIILTTLAEFENYATYEWPCQEATALAKSLVGRNADRGAENKARFARCLRNRPSESVEDLMERASRSPDAFLKNRFLWAINRLFSIVGWQVDIELLIGFLRRRFQDQNCNHSFVSFNYDLVLDRAIQRAGGASWEALRGYGFAIPYFTTEEPGPDVEAGSFRPTQAQPTFGAPDRTPPIEILKHHGSLNWLLPITVPYRTDQHGLVLEPAPMVIPLTSEGHLRYWATTANFNHIQRPNEMPCDHGIFIIPPSSDKRTDMPFLEQIRQREEQAITEAEEMFIIGYSLPLTDNDQSTLIRRAARRRRSQLARLVVINYCAPPDYFRRTAELFSFPIERLEVYNAGFAGYAAWYEKESVFCVPPPAG